MYVKYEKDDGSTVIEKFECGISECVDGIVTYKINGECVYRKPATDMVLDQPNIITSITDKIYKALELHLPIVDLTKK
jgi:hypothetical protein